LGLLFAKILFISGANFIHGISQNPLVPLVEISGSQLTFPDDAVPTIYGTTGRPLSFQTAQLANNLVWEYSKEAIAYSSADSTIPPDVSVNEFCLARLHADENLNPKVKIIVKQLFSLLSDFTGIGAENQSLRHYKVEAELPVIIS
jgi:hypothetical protein